MLVYRQGYWSSTYVLIVWIHSHARRPRHFPSCESRIAQNYVALDILGALVSGSIAYKVFEDRFNSFYADLLIVLLEILGFNS